MDEINLQILKKLISCEDEPCISIYMSTQSVKKGEFTKLKIEFKNLIQEVTEKLKKRWRFNEREIKKMLSRIETLVEEVDFWQNQKSGLAVFLNKDIFEYFKLPVDFSDKTHVSRYFNIKQLISVLWDNPKYYLLALSPNYSKLYKCDRSEINELEINGLPKNIKEFLNLDEEAAESPLSMSKAGTSSIYHGGGGGEEDNEDLLHYLRKINEVVNNRLKNTKEKLIIAADDSLFSHYQNINTYPHMLNKNVNGNPEKIPSDKLYEKSLQLIEPHLHDYTDEVLAKYGELKNTDKSSEDLEDIIEAAYFSKVDTLLLDKTAKKEGFFDKDNNKVKKDNSIRDYDLYNFAALNVIKNGGKVYSLNSEEMPDGTYIAAIYRY
ncbi:hypothetical protein [Halanaerobium sp. MA284_MarDTE_T2]|uniref:baeRF7 domain-containing protein n=1 Tax=Halanaerobium sp. MA284_MarDTE_T2 TaxID=2183913 RepID=UPI000DF281DF|nr:hypothetical protein [Halanaerobium sp. MA284_MarDTE_T2]RCW43771.1 hypothetical protein DFR78_12522 [Halanaerobium sp. MA284_MarDTE_T2]